jgi:hypothetical protein
MPGTAMRNFCTYFDHNYLLRGLALYESLAQNTAAPFVLYVLCLSEECQRLLSAYKLPNTVLLSTADLETFEPRLARARSDRSLVEYYFTCTPVLCSYVLQTTSPGDLTTYLDSDLFFFSDPQPVFEQLADFSTGIIPHNYNPAIADRSERYGAYNVGWLSFRNDTNGLQCLAWYLDQCLAWCYDRPEPGRFADQKYLDFFHSRFPAVRDIGHKGANAAPWNIAKFTVTRSGQETFIDNEKLIFFHFEGFKRLYFGIYDTNLHGYGASMTDTIRENIYSPYLRSLMETRIKYGIRKKAHFGASKRELKASRKNPLTRLFPGLVGMKNVLAASFHAFKRGDAVFERQACRS